jgi:glycosyltransferase involved in cell wall biosynthesis
MKPAEIIVVDNNCTDRTRQIAEEMGAIIIEEKKQGLSAARNAGIKACRYEWIALLDADDLWKKKKTEYQWQAIQQCPEARIISCDFTFLGIASEIKFNIKKRRNKRAAIVVGKDYLYFPKLNAATLDNLGFLPSSTIIHREVFSGVGFFDETISHQEDVEFFMRAVSRYPLAYVHKRLVYYCRHDKNMTSDIKEMEESLRLITEKMVRNPDNYAEGAGQFYLTMVKNQFVARARALSLKRKLSST